MKLKVNKRLIHCGYSPPPGVCELPTPQKEIHFSGKILKRQIFAI